MTRLIYIETSPRKTRSHSIELAQTFLQNLRESINGLEIDTFDLWTESLPEFDGDILDAKYALLQGDSPSDTQKAAWKSVTDVIDRLAAADIVVISTPMWNFGVPYKLKHFIDVIAQPTLTYQARRDATYGEWGLLKNKKGIVISARGGTVAPGSGVEDWDFQSRYLDKLLTFIGITDVSQVAVELTAVDKDTLPKRVADARTRLEAIASRIAAD